jgi:putative cardiolipin synthase
MTPPRPDRAGKTGVFALRDSRDAFSARALLADDARLSIDAQYYIWRCDTTGMLLADALWRAAERGVRVRMLLDDNGTLGMDGAIAALDAHPNIEVRLFNPFLSRRWRYLGYLTDFSRLNRRMHNKSFTVDKRAAIVGGRNVGDEYFGTGNNPLFIDLDVLAVGAVVTDVSADFERYWTSASSYPASRVLRMLSTSAMRSGLGRADRGASARQYLESLADSQFARELRGGTLVFDWVNASLASDDPAKGLGRASDDKLLWQRLKTLLKPPQAQIQIVSPYFVPGAKGVEFLARHAEKGVATTVVTNSLEATDVAAVHAGYAKRRKALLRAGVRLYEMKREFSAPSRQKRRGIGRRSDSSLHAKTMQIDETRVFVGSFNFDPRSDRLNTEMGLVIESGKIAGTVARNIYELALVRCYELRLTARGRLQWLERGGEHELVHDSEPGTGAWRRLFVRLLSLLPIEWLL